MVDLKYEISLSFSFNIASVESTHPTAESGEAGTGLPFTVKNVRLCEIKFKVLKLKVPYNIFVVNYLLPCSHYRQPRTRKIQILWRNIR